MSRLTFAAVTIVAVFTAIAGFVSQASAANPGCPPPPTRVVLCVDDPCNPCDRPQQVVVCVPGCCDAVPCVSWRDGVFGRRVAVYEWRGCGHRVEVVVTRRGEIIVR